MSVKETTYFHDSTRQIYLSTILLCVLFFALTFYLRTTLLDFDLPVTLVFLSVVSLCFITKRQEAFVIVILIMTASVFQLLEFPTIPIVIGDLFVSDVVILLVIVMRLLKKVTTNVVVIPRPMGYPVLVFISVAIFTFFYSILNNGVSTTRAGTDLRVYFYFSLFFLVFYTIRSRQQLKSVLMVLGILAVIYSILQIIQWAIGYETDILGVRLEPLMTAGQTFKRVARVMLPGTSVILFSLNVFLSIFLYRRLKLKWRLILLSAILLTGTGMIFTFTRALWLAVSVGVLVFLFTVRRRMSIYPRIIAFLACSVLIILLLKKTEAVNSQDLGNAVYDRTISIVNMQKNISKDTVIVRLVEIRYALKKIVENPIIGIGFGSSYRPIIFGNTDYERDRAGTFVHNGYLTIQLQMGLLGTLAFLWLIGLFFLRMKKRWRRIKDPLYQATVLGITISVVGILVFGLSSPAPIYFIYWTSVTAVGMGIVEKIYQLEGIA